MSLTPEELESIYNNTPINGFYGKYGQNYTIHTIPSYITPPNKPTVIGSMILSSTRSKPMWMVIDESSSESDD